MAKEKIKLVDGMFVTCELFEGVGEIMETVENPDKTLQHRVRVDMVDGWVPADELTFARNPIADQQKAKKEQDAIRDAGIDGRIAELEAEISALKERNAELEAELEKATAPATPPAPKPGK